MLEWRVDKIGPEEAFEQGLERLLNDRTQEGWSLSQIITQKTTKHRYTVLFARHVRKEEELAEDT